MFDNIPPSVNIRNKMDIINRIKEKIQDINPNKAILFGSYASGNQTKDSDVDLIFIFNHIDNKHETTSHIRNILTNIRVPKDIIVSTNNEFNFYKNEFGSVFKEANEKGIVIYEKTI